jgi:hypothetical protein
MIKGFWHIYMINNWKAIMREQLRILIDSGLYDASFEISIGCLGSANNLLLLEQEIMKFYKLHIKYYSTKPHEYEFPTLQLIEEDNSDYIGYYFHTKGVTRPTDTMQPKERQFLNDMILGHWRHHVFLIDTGYDISSMNYLTVPNRFSGNYFWFSRERIVRLPSIKTVDHSDRYNAEKWIYMKKDKL